MKKLKMMIVVSCLIIISIICFLEVSGNEALKSQLLKANTTTQILYPFGSEILSKRSFPHKWNFPYSESGKPTTIYEKRYRKLMKYYEAISNKDTYYFSSPIKNLTIIKIDDDSLIVTGQILDTKTYSYRLPDIGPYKCYYQVNNNCGKMTSTDSKIYLDLGNLILLNHTKHKNYLLNIYCTYTYNESFADFNRLFYISANNVITIAIIMEGEVSGEFRKSQEITISKTGKFNIKSIK